MMPHSKEGDEIIPYFGENVTRHELDRRYGHNNTAPYGIQKRNGFEDGALSRGVGTLVNHKPEGRDNVALKNSRGTIVIKALKSIKFSIPLCKLNSFFKCYY